MSACYQNFRTRQIGPHPHLAHIVNRHNQSEFLRPIPHHQTEAFLSIQAFVNEINKPLIIDSGCGTGLSSFRLAEQFPFHGVIGIDKSAYRLSKNRTSERVLLVRADVQDIWRLIAKEKFPVTHHFLLYPNPWPKESQVKRRFHAHPVFSTMISLAPYFEMRTNWHVYALECTLALKLLGKKPILELKTNDTCISLFERKYIAARCPIYIVKNHDAS